MSTRGIQQQQQQQDAGAAAADVILAGYLLKQHARSSKRWAERYFILRADNTLRYYHIHGSSSHKNKSSDMTQNKPKAVYELVVNASTDCQVSELFVGRHNKKLIYCIKLTWSSRYNDPAAAEDLSTGAAGGGGGAALDTSQHLLRDDSSSLGEIQLFEDENANFNNLEGSGRATSPLLGSYARRRSGKERKQQQQQQQQTPVATPRSIDQETLSALSIQDRLAKAEQQQTKDATNKSSNKKSSDRKTKKRNSSKRDLVANANNVLLAQQNNNSMSSNLMGEPDHVPSMVEVDQRYYATPPASPFKRPPVFTPNAAATAEPPTSSQTQTITQPRNIATQYSSGGLLEQEAEDEQQYLRSQYLTEQQANKRRHKQKMVQGTKLAVAAGATVGVAVVTAGIGLAAAPIALLAAAALGGGGVAASSKFGGTKKEGQLVIASHDYETAKAWKSCLDAAVETAMVKSSTWGHLFSADAARLALLPTATASRDAADAVIAPTSNAATGGSPKNKAAQARTVLFESHTRWRPLAGGWSSFLGTGVQGLRIFREERRHPVRGGGASSRSLPGADTNSIVTDLMVDGKPCAPVKAHIVLSSSALNAFLCVMSYGLCPSSSSVRMDLQQQNQNTIPGLNADLGTQFRILETIDDSTDVIHLVTLPFFLFPSYAAPRDYVLFRYWRLEPDGKYMICYESVEHESCPPMPNYVRGDMHQVITIAPHKKRLRRRSSSSGGGGNPNECLMTAVAQVDPKGWVPTRPISILANQSYADAFGISALLQLLEIRDAIDFDRFVPNQTLTHQTPMTSNIAAAAAGGIHMTTSTDSMDDNVINEDYVDYDYTYASHEMAVSRSISGLTQTPPPLNMSKWVAPDSNSFRVRGKHYKEDKKKYNAGPSVGRLVAVDLVEVDEPIYSGFVMHPTERVQLALRKEATLKAKGLESDMPAFIFVVNIVLPGPPVYHAVFYYAVDDLSTIDGSDGTPSSKLAKEFFFGDSDEFRDRTFKLIPHIVQGNFIVRKAVGSTPALIGKKLRQLYVRSDRFCEVILDCGSSPVAAGIIRISLGYAASLVVDMAFLLEGDEPAHLPERIFGCVRVKQLEFGPEYIRFVRRPPLDDDDDGVSQ